MKDGLAWCELALTFFEEANRAVQAEVWFAAAAVAAAALEAMLLAKMFMNTDKVAQLTSFKKLLDKHQGDFGSFARKEMDLGRLLDMAKELAWFRLGGVPSFLTEMLAHYVDQGTVTALTVIFKDSPSAGYTSADLLRQYRNLLHPAYCLKQDIYPTKDTGIRATYFCLVAYASLSSIWEPKTTGFFWQPRLTKDPFRNTARDELRSVLAQRDGSRRKRRPEPDGFAYQSCASINSPRSALPCHPDFWRFRLRCCLSAGFRVP